MKSKEKTEKEIEEKILKEVMKIPINQLITEEEIYMNKGEREDLIFKREIKKAISLTLTECKKQKQDFVKKLKDILINYQKNVGLEEISVNHINMEIDELAKSELGVEE